jgi:small-conductance mechanosensitive channel
MKRELFNSAFEIRDKDTTKAEKIQISDKILMCITNQIHTQVSIWRSLDVRKEKDFILIAKFSNPMSSYIGTANLDKLCNQYFILQFIGVFAQAYS